MRQDRPPTRQEGPPLIPCPDCGLLYRNERTIAAHRSRYHTRTHDRIADAAADLARSRRKLRCYIYARVSTDQGEQDPEQQLAVLRREAHTRGFDLVWEGYDMVSGDSHVWERETGRTLWEKVKHGDVDVLMTYDASRLSRQHPVSVFRLLDYLQKYNTTFISATEKHFDFSEENEFREVIIFMTAWMNNWFLKNLRKSTIRGKEAAILKGRPQGRHPDGCGRDFPCPTHAHDDQGRSTRPKQTKASKAGPWRKSYLKEILPPATGSTAPGNPPAENGGA